MSERLDELRRQRALLAQHLAWLDREIAQTEATAPVPLARVMVAEPRPIEIPGASLSAPNVAVASMPTPMDASLTAVDAAAEQLLDEHRVAPESVTADVRKGCFLYFALALLLLAAFVAALYVLVPHRETPPRENAPGQKVPP